MFGQRFVRAAWLGLPFLVLLIVQPSHVNSDPNQQDCLKQMQNWIDEQFKLFPKGRHEDPKRMLYFLHVPRTAGRTTHNCFLMPMTPPSRRCAKSYDGNKYNISVPECGLLSSHDDFSAMRGFPSNTAAFTSIRNPVSRVLSAYEFTIEIASREAVKVISRKFPSASQGRVNTKNVWPWSYLAPFVEQDMLIRVCLRYL
jgi:protein-tyrosine sulfotransferase